MHPQRRVVSHIASLSHSFNITPFCFDGLRAVGKQNKLYALQVNYNYNTEHDTRCTGNNFITVIILINCLKVTCIGIIFI